MLKGFFQNRNLVEIASIAGILALLIYIDMTFDVVSWTTQQLFSTFPGLKRYSVTFVSVSFIGLTVFSISQRARRRQEHRARSKLEEYLRQRDFVDPITGLANRLGLKLMIGELRNSEVSTYNLVLAIEIRNIVSVRSVHGEKIAEQVEAAFARHLESVLQQDDFVAISGRGIFYLLINSSDRDECRFRADNAVESVSALASAGIATDDLTMSTFVSFGLLDLHSHRKNAKDWDAEDILQRVDYALYHARSKGHEIVETYDDVMEAAIRQRAMVEGELLDALTNGQIVPYFQPFIDMKTNRVVGLEILARWAHPVHGFVPPDVFVPIAEDVGAMRALTLSMLRQACVSARHWPETISLAFNISPNELRNDVTMDSFFEVLRSMGVDADRVEIEITENAFIEEVGEISEAVAKLKKRGIQISIDDFGTGFSSLRHLKMLPFDKIKIDQSFVRDMATNPNSHAIVQNIIALGKSLGLPTIAEGIELDQNRDLLRDLGCAIGQGYLFAKPLKADEVLPFIQSYKQQISSFAQVA